MKKLILSCSLVLMALNSFATGVMGNNQPQSGSLAITNAGPVGRFTNSFPYSFTQAPVVVLSGSAGPFTINSVTTTNFDATTTSTNNTLLNWTAYLGYPRIQTGVATTTTLIATNISFSIPYAYAPVVVVAPGGTNADYQAAVTSVTVSNFTLRTSQSSTNQWSAIGQAYTPGNSTVTY